MSYVELRVVPMSIKAARRFVGQHHRHNLPPVGGLFAVGVAHLETVVGVGIAGRPVARALDDGSTVELIRSCTLDGVPNANSMLYGALCRAAKALGYRRAYTYSLVTESGVSLKAAGFVIDAELDARPTWDTPSRPREQTDLFGDDRRPPGAKRRWRRDL